MEKCLLKLYKHSIGHRANINVIKVINEWNCWVWNDYMISEINAVLKNKES